jgi:hypothetical protein
MISAAFVGCAVGLIIYLGGNWMFHRSLGLASPLVGIVASRGDHYVPILESGWRDIVEIASRRYRVFSLLLLASMLWVPVVVFWKRVKSQLFLKRMPVVATLAAFLFFSTLFTEATSNGFHLYSSVAFFILVLSLSVFSLEQLKNIGKWRIAILAPIAVILVYANFNMRKTFRDWFRYSSTFPGKYESVVGSCIESGSSGMMRPTFAFALANKKGRYEYSFYLLQFMNQNKLSFSEALLTKGYDVIAIDEQDQADLFAENRDKKDINTFYRQVSGVVVSKKEFDQMVTGGALAAVCKYEDISHGSTTFYRINHVLLRQFVSRLNS